MAGETYDVVIVGAGVAGALIGSRLALAGAKVVILESGPRVDRDEAVNRYRGAIAKTPESPYPGTDWAPRPDTLDLDLYYVQSGPEKFKSTYERRVGGTTWHWLGTSIRLLPSDFEMKTRYGVGVDWPLSYQELEPWYGEAERELGVAGDSSRDLGSPRSTDYPMPPIPISYGDQLWAKAAATLGLNVEPTPQARNSVEYQGPPGLLRQCHVHPDLPDPGQVRRELPRQGGGGCRRPGDRERRRASHRGRRRGEGHRNWVQDAGWRGADDRGPGVRGRGQRDRDGEAAVDVDERGDSAMASPTPATRWGAISPIIPIQLSIAASKEPYYPYRGPLSVAGIATLRDGDFRARAQRVPDRDRQRRLVLAGDGPAGGGAGADRAGLRRRSAVPNGGRAHPLQVRLASLTEQLPNPDNRIVPDDGNRDAIGIPRPKLSYQYDEYTIKGIQEARAIHDALFNALGVTFKEHVQEIQGAGHVMGTHRMGSDPNTSVTDADGRTHDHPNLFLAGCGLFPTIGTQIQP